MPRSPHPLKVVIAPESQLNHPDRINYYLRAWADAPLQNYKVERRWNDDGTLICKLEELAPNEPVRLIGAWRDQDAPWLYPFLSNVLPRLHGAWHIAQEHLKVIKGTKKHKSRVPEKTQVARDALINEGRLSDSEIAKKLQRAKHTFGVSRESIRLRRKILANLMTSEAAALD